MSTTQHIGVKHPVIHFEIMSAKPDALRTFYRDVFDWAIAAPAAEDPMQYGTIDPDPDDNSVISGGIGKAPEGYAGHVTFYIRVDDVETAFAKIEANGGSRMTGPTSVTMQNGAAITIGLFRDPDGRTIGLVDVGDAM